MNNDGFDVVIVKIESADLERLHKKIKDEYDTKYNRHLIQRESMKPITIRGYRELMEKYWCEFEE